MDDKTIEFLEKMFSNLDNKIDKLSSDIQVVKNQVTKIEVEHGNKLDALFDGYKQSIEGINSIRKEMNMQEEITFKRVK